MPRIITVTSDTVHDGVRPHVATLAARGLRAMLVLEPTMHDPHLVRGGFLALGADGRLRSGELTLSRDPEAIRAKAVPGFAVHPLPGDADALADIIAKVVDAADSSGGAEFQAPPFTFHGWSPWTPDTKPACPVRVDRQAEMDTGLSWLPMEPVLGSTALNRAWGEVLNDRVPSATQAAAETFARCRHLHAPAFDAACHPGPEGEARRAFAHTNPLLANTVLAHPAALALVDAGASLRAVLDALSADDTLELRVGGGLRARKAGLMRMSGAYAKGLMYGPYAGIALAAAEALPLEWMPRGEAETEAFVAVCRGAYLSYGVDAYRRNDADWWRGVLAGSGGNWTAYARRVEEACAFERTPDSRPAVDESLAYIAERRAHFVDDLLIPLARAHGGEALLSLLSRNNGWLSGMTAPGFTALDSFAHHCLTVGMSLPAVADQGRRHRKATAAITGAAARFPVPERDRHRVRSGAVYLTMGDGEHPLHGSDVSRRPLPYDTDAPGAIAAVLDAWRPVLPRRMRRLDAAGLAALLESEAAAFA